MPGNSKSGRKFFWIALLIVISILVSLFWLRLTNQRKWRESQTNNSRRPTSGEKRSAFGPGSSFLGTEASNHYVIFHVVDGTTLTAIEGATLTIRLVGEEPAATPFRGKLVTDKGGTCTVLLSNQTCFVSVRASGYVSRYLNFQSAEDFSAEYTFRIERGRTIGGIVQDPEGRPLSRVQMEIHTYSPLSLVSKPPYRDHISPSVNVETDPVGRWKCTEIPSDSSRIAIRLSHPEFTPVAYSTNPASAPDLKMLPIGLRDLESGGAVLIMPHGLVITGSVTDEGENGIEGAKVSRREGLAAQRIVSTVLTSLDGHFIFMDAKLGETRIEVQAQGYSSAARTIQVAREMPEIHFKLKKGHTVRGRVVDEEGASIANVDIRAYKGMTGSDLQWRGRTDAVGCFLWDSAPEIPLYYQLYSGDFITPFFLIVLKPDIENEITLRRLPTMHVSGRVTDSKTKVPIDVFTVLMLRSSSLDQPAASATGTNGDFSVTVKGQTDYHLRVDATGYTPKTYPVEFKEGDTYLEVEITRGDGPWGILRFPGGQTVPGAKAFLCGGISSITAAISGEKAPAAPVMTGLDSIQAGSGGALYFKSTITDEEGRFTFSAMPEAHTVIASHEKGFISVDPQQLADSHSLTLQPWGKVEGNLWIGAKAGSNQAIRLVSLNGDFVLAPREINVNMATYTDVEGKFWFRNVPPGEYRLMFGGQSAFAVVHPGETVKVTLGGIGRPITGTIVVLGVDTQVDYAQIRPQLTLEIPEPFAANKKKLTLDHAWRQTEEANFWLRAQRSYLISVDPDGFFRIEDIPAGTYTLRVSVSIPDPVHPTQTKRGSITRQIIVGEMGGGRSAIPLELGQIFIEILERG